MHVEASKDSLAAYLMEQWLPTLNRQRAKTRADYKMICEKWIAPHIGAVPLDRLTPAHVQTLIDTLKERGARGGKPLSGRSVAYAFTVLKAALTAAVRRGFIPRNPADAVERPASKGREMEAWTAGQARAFLAHAEGDRLAAAWLLFLTRGFRRGELAGLRWPDVDLEAGRVQVRHTRVVVDRAATGSTPKTDRGTRTVPLDDRLSAALRAHKKRQIEERLAWGEAWTDSGYVFTQEDGEPYHPERFSDRFDRLVKAAGLPRISLHGTRHTAATLALQAGIPTEVVSRWLGHANVSITQSIYQHAIPSMLEEAGAKLTALILG